MTDHRFSDAQLEAMLRERAGAGAPSDLRSSIVLAARAEPRRPVASRWTGTRLLAVAAILGTAAVGSMLAGGALLQDEDPAPDSVPVAPSQVAVTPSDEPAASTSSVAIPPCGIYPGPGAGPVRDPGSIGDPVTTPGDLFVLAAPGAGLYATRVAPMAGATGVRIGDVNLPSAGRLAASPDGRWVALDSNGAQSPGDVGSCGGPLLVSTGDGSVLRPFPITAVEAVYGVAWSRDGRTLYGIHQTRGTGPRIDSGPDAAPGSIAPDAGSLVAWDRASGVVRSLGTPCHECVVVGVYPQPDADGIFATVAPACADPSAFDCALRLARFDGERWSVVGSLLEGEGNEVEAVGAAAGGRFVVHSFSGDRLGLVPASGIGDATWAEPPCCHGLNNISVSPDGTSVAGIVSSDDFLETQVVVLDLEAGAWRTVATIKRRTDPLADDHFGFVGSVWSPDSAALAFSLIDNRADPVIRIVRSGDAVEDVVVGNTAEVIAWLPARE